VADGDGERPDARPSGWGHPNPGPPRWERPGSPDPAWTGPGPGEPPWAPRDTAARPGIVPLRPLGVGEILDGALQAVRRNPGPMLLVTAIVGALYGVAVTGLGLLSAFGSGAGTGSTAASSEGSLALVQLVGLLPAVAVFGLALVAVTALLTVVVANAALGQRTSVRQAWRFARSRVLPAIGASLVVGIGAVLALLVGGGLIAALLALVVAGTGGVARGVLVGLLAVLALTLVLTGRLGIASVVVVLDGRWPVAGRAPGVSAAIRRTWRLTRGHMWRTLGILLLLQLIAGLAAQVITIVVGVLFLLATLVGLSAGIAGAVGGALVVLITQVVILPFTVAGTTLIYLDLRMRREGLDLELAAAVDAVGRPDAAPPTGAVGWSS